ncbi:MAG: stage IV sporulation protein A [Ruminococcaceae bacterium]|nr:stage IV sporulation protein A [Oscillospiraceae bacterium]
MAERSIYSDIADRTGGDIYIGVVGPVRTGKSTFIQKFMDTLVIPNIENSAVKTRAVDELPQSAAGRTIMTTEPKFIPENAVEITLPENAALKVRMIDCVGYIVPSSMGYIEGEQPRMVHTPWFEEEIPFNMAAEIGTKKVITEHSTIGLVVTTDGSISDIPREEYEIAEERVIDELKELNKPFIILLNCTYPDSESAVTLARELSEKYSVPVLPVNCLELNESKIKEILTQILFEFPIKEIGIKLPAWLLKLENTHWLKSSIREQINTSSEGLSLVRDINLLTDGLRTNEYIRRAEIGKMDLGKGSALIDIETDEGLFYKIITEKTGIEIENEEGLMTLITELSRSKAEYEKIKYALDEVENTGYGIIMPGLDELTLKEPEIIKQGGRYGVKLSASAPSIHMLKANIETEVAPIVGTESQSEELIKYLLEGFEEEPTKIWESNIFGKSLNELVNEGLRNKLFHMPNEARMKMQETLQRVINEGCNGLICIIL